MPVPNPEFRLIFLHGICSLFRVPPFPPATSIPCVGLPNCPAVRPRHRRPTTCEGSRGAPAMAGWRPVSVNMAGEHGGLPRAIAQRFLATEFGVSVAVWVRLLRGQGFARL